MLQQASGGVQRESSTEPDMQRMIVEPAFGAEGGRDKCAETLGDLVERPARVGDDGAATGEQEGPLGVGEEIDGCSDRLRVRGSSRGLRRRLEARRRERHRFLLQIRCDEQRNRVALATRLFECQARDLIRVRGIAQLAHRGAGGLQ